MVDPWPHRIPYQLKGNTVTKVSRYWKAILAALIPIAAIITELVQAYENGAADGTFDGYDQIKLAVAVVLALSVYAKANVQPADEPYDPSVSEAEAGHGVLETIVIAAAVSIVVLALYVLLF